jgi:putative FmdB family regulatory protein
MPRYRYMCNECTLTFTLVHGINEVLVDCPKCDATQSMEKLLSTPIIIKSDIQISQDKVGELTKEYIEENRRILQEQIKEAKSEDYEQT